VKKVQTKVNISVIPFHFNILKECNYVQAEGTKSPYSICSDIPFGITHCVRTWKT